MADMKLRKERRILGETENKEEVLEFLKGARTLGRQVTLLRGIELNEREEEVIRSVLKDLVKEFSLFRI